MSDKPSVAERPAGEPSPGNRRGFVKLAAILCGALAGLVPTLAGLLVFLDPLRRKAQGGNRVKVATLDSVPDDGVARYFPVVADQTDAWNRYVDVPIGAVFLLRQPGASEVLCFNAICPHAGCFVNFNAAEGKFQCPCHDSTWQPTGERINPEKCPSPRDLDPLAVDSDMLVQGEVWVEFQNFLTATPERIPKA